MHTGCMFVIANNFPLALHGSIGLRGHVRSSPVTHRITTGPVGNRWSPSTLVICNVDTITACFFSVCLFVFWGVLRFFVSMAQLELHALTLPFQLRVPNPSRVTAERITQLNRFLVNSHADGLIKSKYSLFSPLAAGSPVPRPFSRSHPPRGIQRWKTEPYRRFLITS